MSYLRLLLAAAFSIFLSVSVHAEGQRAILVLDASGSMWGQINGMSKMEIAKEVVGKVVGAWNPADELGLVVYGHRKKGACDDIETVIEPGKLDAAQYMKAVKGISPKGKTPMTQAVRVAAEALKYTEKKATVILVSDGIETCDPNPCAVAEELEKLGVDLTVHTVGFGLDDQGAVAQLKCLAEKTGGQFKTANSAEELQEALNTAVKAEPAPPPAPAAPDYNFKGHAIMAEGVELPKPFDEVVWVFNTAQGSEVGEYLSTEYHANVKANVPKTGDLIAKVTSDLASAMVPFHIDEGKATEVEVNFNAGVVAFSAMMDESTPLTSSGAVWVFSKSDGTYVGTSYGPTPKQMFNAGDYKVKLEDGQAKVEGSFSVEAGKTSEVVVTLGSGAVRYTVTYTPGGDAVADGVAVELRKAADISGEKKYIATEYGAAKSFKAAAGDYVLVASLNLAKAEAPVKIEAGKEVQASVNLDAGFLAVKAPGAKVIEVQAGKAGIDGKHEHLATEYAAELNYAVNTGTYHVVAMGDGDAVIGEKDVTITAGQRTEISIP